MQDNVMQNAIQPFIKLAQANMELVSQFSLSNDAMTSARNLFQQEPGAATNVLQSNGFARLAQGMFKNYTEFMSELNQNAMAMFAQGQATMVRQTQEVTDNIVEASQATARRARQA